jgi:hypothetical protein
MEADPNSSLFAWCLLFSTIMTTFSCNNSGWDQCKVGYYFGFVFVFAVFSYAVVLALNMEPEHYLEARNPPIWSESSEEEENSVFEEEKAAPAQIAPPQDEEALTSESECLVCRENKRIYVMISCGHLIACASCKLSIESRPCIICNGVNTGWLRVFD